MRSCGRLVQGRRGARGQRLPPPPRSWTARTADLTRQGGQRPRPLQLVRACCADWSRHRGKSSQRGSEPPSSPPVTRC
eukprot:2902424-Pyramimonas_sp.AAC.1